MSIHMVIELSDRGGVQTVVQALEAYKVWRSPVLGGNIAGPFVADHQPFWHQNPRSWLRNSTGR